MQITAIRAQARNSERVSIYVDGKYSFSLTRSQLLEHKLHSGKRLNDYELAGLKHASNYGKILERVVSFIMIRPRSIREVRDYFRRKQVDPGTAGNIIQRLTDRGQLNDADFAKSWVRARQLAKPVSRQRLLAELRQKGVTAGFIDQAFAAENYDEAQALRELIAKKRRQARYQDNQKLMQYLARQGFAYGDIKSALDETD